MNRMTLIAALFLLVAGWIYFQPWMDAEQPEASPQQTYSADYVANNLYTRSFDIDGRLQTWVYADRMESFQDIGLTLFTEPAIRYYTYERFSPWLVNASEGSFFPDKQEIQLQGSVRLTGTGEASQIQEVQTDYMVLELDKQLIYTDHPITAQGPQLTMKGIGMRADMQSKQISILEAVEATYENSPNH